MGAGFALRRGGGLDSRLASVFRNRSFLVARGVDLFSAPIPVPVAPRTRVHARRSLAKRIGPCLGALCPRWVRLPEDLRDHVNSSSAASTRRSRCGAVRGLVTCVTSSFPVRTLRLLGRSERK